MSAHTPGPWAVHPKQSETRPVRVGRERAGPGYTVAQVMTYPLGKETCLANARLIAAAPELLAFVADVAKNDPVFAKGHEKQRIHDARALLAKATIQPLSGGEG